MQWRENNVPLTACIEVLSSQDTPAGTAAKLDFCTRHGASEVIIVGPQPGDRRVEAWVRDAGGVMRPAARLFGPADGGWTSPRLGLRFTVGPDDVLVAGPNGQPLRSFVETEQALAEAEARAAAEAVRAERLAARLRELGVDPDAAG